MRPAGVARASGDAIEQPGRWDVEPVGELDDGGQAGVSAGAFEQADLGPMEPDAEAQFLLREPDVLSGGAEVLREEGTSVRHNSDGSRLTTEALQTKPRSSAMFRPMKTKTLAGLGTATSRTGILVVLVTLGLGLAPTADAATNTGPSTAVEVSAGVPFFADWAGTPLTHDHFSHWYRPSFPLRTGDELQLAIDNTQGRYDLQVCLTSPTDEFGAGEILKSECDGSADVSNRSMRRVTKVYSRSAPNGLLAIVDDVGCCGTDSVDGSYTATIERIITRVNIGFVAPRRIGRSLTLKSALRYGDNTPVADGIASSLQLQPIYPGRRSSFKTIARATSTGSTATFTARLAKRHAKTAQLRACVEQPGGTTTRCTRAYRVTVK